MLLSKDFILATVRPEAPPKNMARVTSKYQVTVPWKIAEKYHIHPGDDIDWAQAGDVIRVIPPGKQAVPQDRESQLRLFDQATERHRKRPSARPTERLRNRAWRREDLYTRGRTR
jgi:bifunctional DNA-binding transcriptional regulator/antitoxin component of YhaV-PrlF toxin-antitoxin module